MMKRESYIMVRVSPREKACIEAASEKEGMSVSDYVRAGAMITAMVDGNREARAITREILKARFGQRWANLIAKCNVVM